MPETTAQTAMLNLIKELRSDPKRYLELKKKVGAAKTDQERVKVLTDFTVKEKRLQRVVPHGPGGAEAAITTVTVTTVIIIVPSAY